MSKLEEEGIPYSAKRKNNEGNLCMMNILREPK
jgi:hypothetical protein